MWAKYLVDGRSQTIMTRMLTVIQVQGTLNQVLATLGQEKDTEGSGSSKLDNLV